MLFKECFSDSVQQETDVSWNKILILKLSWLYCLYIIRYRISSINLDINCKMAVFSEKKIILCRSVNLASIGVLFFTKRRLSFCLIFSLILRKWLLELAFFLDNFTSFNWNNTTRKNTQRYYTTKRLIRYMYYSLYNWIGEHEIKMVKKNFLLPIQKKGHKNNHKKTLIKFDYLIFSEIRMRKRHLLCTSSHHNVPRKNNKSSTRGLSLEMSVLARARAQWFNMLYISTHLSLPHGEIN